MNNNIVPAGGGHQVSEDSPSEIVHIPFHGDELQAVDIDSKPYIVFRRVVESLGLDYSTQLAKLRGRSWVSRRDIPTTGADGKTYTMVTVSEATFLMWLATVNENKVADRVRPLLVAYQTESSDALRDYWTKGAAINPRYSPAEQAAVLAALTGVVDAGWLDAKGRQLAGRVLGEAPEFDEKTKPLTVSIYLDQMGMKASEVRKVCSTFGRALKERYRATYATEPPQMEDVVGRHTVKVAQYQEQHRPLFDEVWRALNRDSGGSARPRGRRR